MHPLLEQIWLPEPPEDFNQQCRAASAATDIKTLPTRLKTLARTRLTINQATKLSTLTARRLSSCNDAGVLTDCRVFVLSQGTTTLLRDCLPAIGLRRGLRVTVTEGDYDQLLQQASDPAADVNSSAHDAVVLLFDHRALKLGEQSNAADAIAFVRQVIEGLQKNGQSPIIVGNLAAPYAPLLGSADLGIEQSPRSQIATVNAEIKALCDQQRTFILDLENFAAAVGTTTFFNAREWNSYKLPFASQTTVAVAELIARLLAALKGKALKCVVLDLDDTLWGGTVGEEGASALRIGQGDPVGEAHAEFQSTLMKLKQRGILLAVCSKNDHENAIAPFSSRPEMVLAMDDFVVFIANWSRKSENLLAIAKQLNIGLDSLLFVDDNPFERGHVREALPEVDVIELPRDPALYTQALYAGGYFETVTLSETDASRTQQYADNAKRQVALKAFSSIDNFLASLEMTVTISPLQDDDLPRFCQLINKTNQFNLTTHRYSEADIKRLRSDNAAECFQVRLADKFGDAGLISVVILLPKDAGLQIDTWLMSCRVLGRRVEDAVMQFLISHCAHRGGSQLEGLYIPTAKNSMVSDLYEKHGFSRKGDDNDVHRWTIAVSDYEARELPFSALSPYPQRLLVKNPVNQ